MSRRRGRGRNKKNKSWIWIMIVLIIVCGYFYVKMNEPVPTVDTHENISISVYPGQR